MSDIQPEDSASNAGSRTSTSSASKLAALKVKLEFTQKRARLQEEQAIQQARLEEEQVLQQARLEEERALQQVHLQEEKALQQVRTENELEILSAEEEVAVAEAEILAEEERSVHGSQVRSNTAGHHTQPQALPGTATVASFDTDRDITNHMPPAAHSSPVRSARVSPVRQPTSASISRPHVSPSRQAAGAPVAGPDRIVHMHQSGIPPRNSSSEFHVGIPSKNSIHQASHHTAGAAVDQPARQPTTRYDSRPQVHLSRPRTGVALSRSELAAHVRSAHGSSDTSHATADTVPQHVDFNTSGLARQHQQVFKASKAAVRIDSGIRRRSSILPAVHHYFPVRYRKEHGRRWLSPQPPRRVYVRRSKITHRRLRPLWTRAGLSYGSRPPETELW